MLVRGLMGCLAAAVVSGCDPGGPGCGDAGSNPYASCGGDQPSGNTCSSFTYSAWSACTGGTHTRTVTSASPSGCTGGNRVLSESCSALDGAAIYAAKCAVCHGPLASSDRRGVSAAAITAQHKTLYGTAAEMQAVADALK